MFRSSLDEDNYCGIDELFILSSADEDSSSLKAMAMLREAIEDVGIKKKKNGDTSGIITISLFFSSCFVFFSVLIRRLGDVSESSRSAQLVMIQ